MDKKTDLASRRILSVTEEELSRIILDIHDGPVQYLFASLSLIEGLQPEPGQAELNREELQEGIGRVGKLIEASLSEIKTFLGVFRPPAFQKREVASIIQGLAIQHESLTGQVVNLEIESLPDTVALPVKIALYRILQEALSNIHRHAEVKEQDVRIWSDDDMICLEVIDQGKGFEPPQLKGPDGTELEEHIGLRGMRERVSLLEGEIEITSSPGKGTRLLVKIPIYD